MKNIPHSLRPIRTYIALESSPFKFHLLIWTLVLGQSDITIDILDYTCIVRYLVTNIGQPNVNP